VCVCVWERERDSIRRNYFFVVVWKCPFLQIIPLYVEHFSIQFNCFIPNSTVHIYKVYMDLMSKWRHREYSVQHAFWPAAVFILQLFLSIILIQQFDPACAYPGLKSESDNLYIVYNIVHRIIKSTQTDTVVHRTVCTGSWYLYFWSCQETS